MSTTKISLEQLIEEMKNVGDFLVPYNWPKNNPNLEDDINILKIRHIDFCGYDIVINFNRADYGDYYVETFQLYGEKIPFLPFSLVAELGKRFLGSHKLSLTEIIKSDKKLYCWIVYLDKSGKPIKPVYKQDVDKCVYDGFVYNYVYPSQVNYY